MSWQEYSRKPRSLRSQRAIVRRARGTERECRPLEPERAAMVAGAEELRRYEEYVSRLVGLHVECGERFDWKRVGSKAPRRPMQGTHCEQVARRALELFRPGIADRLSGRAGRLRAKLEARVEGAIEQDRAAYESALEQYGRACEQWQRSSELTPGVLAGDLGACREAIDMLDAYGDVKAFGIDVELESPGVVVCVLRDPELVPREEPAVTPDGLLAARPMVPRKYWALFRDHVHSCAVRVGRETFAALPIDRVTVNVLIDRGGRRDPILAVQFSREQLERLIVRGMDPRDAIRAFPHRLRFHTSVGFDRIESMASPAGNS